MDQNNQQGYNPYGGQPNYNPNSNPNPYQQAPQWPQTPQMPPFSETSANNAFNYGPTGKSRGIYAVLALAFGSIGLHYFYTGKIGAGVITILLVLITCGVWWIIPVIQGILAFWTMTNEEFYYRHVITPSFFPFF